MRYVRWRRRNSRGVVGAAVLMARVLGIGVKPAAGLLGPGGVAAGRVAGAVTSAGDALEHWASHRGSDANLLRVSRRGRPIRVRDAVDPIQLGVHPAPDAPAGDAGAPRHPPFVARDMTPRLCGEVAVGSGFVLLVGESTAGKTRAAYEAMRDLLPSYKLVAPADRAALVSLVHEICGNRRVVVWLDDLDLYLGADGLTAGMVARMLAGPEQRILILATMSARAHEHFSAYASAGRAPDNELARDGREVIKLAREIRMERMWSAGELTRARVLAGDTRIAAAVRHADTGRCGVAEYLAAGPELLNAWQDAWEPGTHPRGAALVRAAVDVRRAGCHRPLPVEFLRGLHEVYLEQRGGEALRPEPWSQALAWATNPLHATSSLLLPRGDRYLSFDYLHDALDAHRPPPRIPDETWRVLIEYADAAGALDIGAAALGRGDWHHAMTALDKAVRLGEPMARGPHALCVRDAGDPKQGAELFAALVAESTQEHGPTAEQTLGHRYNYARSVGDCGRHGEAVKLLNAVIADRTRVLGPHDPKTLGCRNYHAFQVGAGGDPLRAIELYEEVLADLLAELGPDHPLTLNNRFGRAYYTGEAGRPARAAGLFEELVADRTRVQGPFDWATLNNRRHHAHFLGEAGHAARAAALFEALVVDCLQTLDPTHPDTIACRYGHARFVGEAGDPHRAALLLGELLDDKSRMRAYGPDNIVTLVHRRYHAYFVGEAGDPREAARLTRALVSDTRRILGPNHKTLLVIRSTHARETGLAGRYATAALMYDRVRRDSERILGPDDPITLSARSGHARFLGKTGSHGEAAALFEIIVVDRTRVLGSTHPSTLNSRNAYANAVGLAGDPARAARLLEGVLLDRTRLFGPEHPWTRRTEIELARFR